MPRAAYASETSIPAKANGTIDSATSPGSGQSFTVAEVARRLAEALGREDVAPEIMQRYRVGDIRHCFADISRARAALGYEPKVGLDEGLTELAGWLEGRHADDRVAEARAELTARGLTV